MKIDVTPTRGPADGPLAIALSGFPPRSRLTMRASLADPHGRVWSARAVFDTDGHGAVDLDAEGLLCSLEPEGAAPRMPFDESSLAPLIIQVSVELEGAVVAATTVERQLLGTGCRAIPVKEDGLSGTLFQPAGDGPFPTVLVLGGSSGGQVFSGQCAALLAGHGYASLALGFFGAEGLPQDLIGIPLEYFARAMRWLQARPFARAGGTAVVGRSRGGELALLLAATLPEVRAVVAYCPSNVVWGGLRNRQGVDAPAWTHGDRAVPYLAPRLTPSLQAQVFGKRPVSLRPLFDAPVDPAAESAATIPVERARGPVLLISGDDDAMWSAGRMSDAVIERLKAHRYAHPFAHLRFAGAGHLWRAPGMPTSVIDSPMFALGGTPEGQARGNRQAWTALLRTLAEGAP
jgi:dienelactone hydrolase